MNKTAPKTGLPRLWAAFGHSLAGLQACFRSEAAFRQEFTLFLLLLPILALLPIPLVFKAVLFSATLTVLIVELLNTAIEAVVDMVSPDYHDLAKQAKDIGSAAVLLSILLAGATWAAALYTVFF